MDATGPSPARAVVGSTGDGPVPTSPGATSPVPTSPVPNHGSRADRGPAGLVAQGLTFVYPNGVVGVRDFSGVFPPGSLSAITGVSGSGKSTLLYLLGLLHLQSAGEVLLDGEPTARLPDARRAGLRAHLFGFVFQDAALDPTRTVLDNVVETALYRHSSRRPAVRRAHELLEQFGVDLRADHRPGQISGGQAQRIALCRGLLGDPRYILADEPTGNLDAGSRDLVIAALRERAEAGACVIIATHDAQVVADCDEQITLEAPPPGRPDQVPPTDRPHQASARHQDSASTHHPDQAPTRHPDGSPQSARRTARRPAPRPGSPLPDPAATP